VPGPPRISAPEPNEKFGYFVRRPGLRLVISLQGLRLGRFGGGVLSAVTDSTGPLDQSEGTARQSIELLRIALASGVLQCIDSSAAKLFRVLWFLGTIKVGHCR
jgi:hypothetical protein